MRRFLAFVLKLIGAVITVAALAAVAVYLSDPVFWKRLFTLPMEDAYKAVEWYEPLEAVEGFETDIPSADPASRSITAAALEQAERYADENDSVALIVHHRGAIQLEKYWPGYGRQTRTDPASMHKSVMGLLYGIAIAEGHIDSVDDPVGKYLTEWARDPRGQITIRNLLQMSSGLEVPPFSFNPFSRSMKLRMGTDISELVLTTPLETGPGSDFQYSNVNAQLLGLILERATGERYAKYLSSRLWSQIGAPTAYAWLDRTGGMARTFCCLQTTARGWLQVGRLILSRGRAPDGEPVVPEQWVIDATTPAATNPNYGYQLWLGSPAGKERRYSRTSVAVAKHSEPFLAPDVVFLDGWGGQRVYVVPSHELVIVRTGRPQTEWDDARLVNVILRGLGHDAPPTAASG